MVADGGRRDAKVPDLARRDVRPPDLKAPDLKLTDLRQPDLKAHDFKLPRDARAPDSAGPDKGSPPCDDRCNLVSCATVSPCVDPTRTLVIHEVFCLKPDYVVLRNASTTAVDIENYVLETWGTIQETFTLPKRVLQPGETVAIFEYSYGGWKDINTGSNIPFYSGFLSNAVVLRSPGNAVIDYVGFGVTPLKGLPTGINQVGGPVSYGLPFNADGLDTDAHFRAGMKGKTPTFQSADWVVGKKSR